jgi:glycosyltransferase involved in cell wall biosynthesis
MSVALVTNYIPPYRLPLYRLLAERHGVEVFCFGGEGSYVADHHRKLAQQVAQAPFPAHVLRHQRDAARLARDHDAVVAMITGRVALPAAWLGAQRARRPFVLWASMWRHPRTLAHALSFPVMRRIYRRADAILTYGEHVSRYVTQHRGSDRNVFVAPQAVEADLFGRPVGEDERTAWRTAAGIRPAAPLVLYVGRLVREKGVETLLSAWEASYRDGETLCLAGEGPLRGRATAPHVTYTGHVERDTLPVAYAAADVVVVPSLDTPAFLEPWGLVCNEAMHQGRPVVATAAVGAAAGGLVRHGETGLVVAPGDAQALGGAIRSLLDDPERRARLGAAGREAVAAFSHEAAADAFGRALAAVGVETPALR